MNIEIQDHKNLMRSGALQLCLEVTVELMKAGLSDRNDLGLHNSYRTLTAVDKDTNQVVGAIVFYLYNHENDFWLQFGCVKKKYRCQGVYHILWDKLVEIAKEEGRRAIDAGSYMTNDAIVRFNEKVGRKMIPAATFHYEVPTNAKS